MHPFALLLTLLLLAPALQAQTPGCALGNATADLAANNVRARLYNTGGLFWKGGGPVYNVPKVPEGQPITPNSIFAAGIWMGGKVGGEVRMVAADYSQWELWPGPLGTDGKPPADCTPYDRIFTVSMADIAAYDAGMLPTADLRDWPWQWGAPVVDGDGVPNNYNLAGGDRPEVLGDETHWWVMNDAANLHASTGTPPLHMEVRVSAFAADGLTALSNTTFYRYRLTYRGTAPLDSAYFSFWADPDLGNATDDYVGSDTLLDMGFVYNSDGFDEGTDGYGNVPPALGITVLQGVRPMGSRQMGVFFNYDIGGLDNPRDNTSDWYNFIRGRWQDGRPVVACGDGHNPAGLACAAPAQPTTFMWPGDPVTGQFWSERNADGTGTLRPTGDRKFLVSTGPFSMQPGQTEEVAFAIVWARGNSHLDSVRRLREDTRTVRALWEQGLNNLPPVAAPAVAPRLLSPASGAQQQPAVVTLHWEGIESASRYDLRLRAAALDTTLAVSGTQYTADLAALGVPAGTMVLWGVRGRTSGGVGPWSGTGMFTTTGATLATTVGGFSDFLTVANSAGPLDPPEYAAFAFNASDFPHPTTSDRPDGTRQQTAGRLSASKGWGIFTPGPYTTYAQWLGRVLAAAAGDSYEWRFTGQSVAVRRFEDNAVVTVPFEIWNLGPDAADTSDDYRMIPAICESACGAGKADGVFDIGGDSPISGGGDDPVSDAIWWYEPLDQSPGTAGYNAYAADVAAGNAARYFSRVSGEALRNVALMGWNFGDPSMTYPQQLPEQGTVFRMVGQPANLDAPVLAAPAAGAALTTTAVQLFWNEPATNTPQRVVQVARDAAFADVVRADTVFAIGQHALWGLDAGQTYHWRVRQLIEGAIAGPWSEPGRFTVSATATGAEQAGEVPVALTLEKLWPNPAADRATLRYGLPAAGPVRVALYDVLGREVARVAEATQAAGWHEVVLPLGSLASGVYVVRVAAGGRQATRTLVVAR